MKRVPFVLGLIVMPLALVSLVAANQPQTVIVNTEKPLGPNPGTWSASGAIAESGTFRAVSFQASGSGAPQFQITDVTFEFENQLGMFKLRAHIKETLTDDPNVLIDEGTWVILDGTGSYAKLHGQGDVVGTVNENNNTINRTFSGAAHFE